MVRLEGEERREIFVEHNSGANSASLIPKRLMSDRPFIVSGRSKSGLPVAASPCRNIKSLGTTKYFNKECLTLRPQITYKLSSFPTTSNRQDYLKAILSIELKGGKASTSAIAARLNTQPASVTGMLKVLSDNDLVSYVPYQGAVLTKEGKSQAINLIRKHRLWETFMVDKLGFGWEEVHEVAEQLEHIDSEKLIDKLDVFLGSPRFDPHGDPIPDTEGNISDRRSLVEVNTIKVGEKASVRGVLGSSDSFLKHLDDLGIKLGLEFSVVKIFEYDGSYQVKVKGKEKVWSRKLVEQLLAEKK